MELRTDDAISSGKIGLDIIRTIIQANHNDNGRNVQFLPTLSGYESALAFFNDDGNIEKFGATLIARLVSSRKLKSWSHASFVFYCLAGGAASGKSTVGVTFVDPSHQPHTFVVDADVIKTFLPHFHVAFLRFNGCTLQESQARKLAMLKACDYAHDISSAVASVMLSQLSRKRQYHVLYDGTMKDHKKGIERLKMFKQRDFATMLCVVVVDPQVALNRNASRDRSVDPSQLLRSHTQVNKAVPVYTTNRWVDHMMIFDNSAELAQSSDDVAVSAQSTDRPKSLFVATQPWPRTLIGYNAGIPKLLQAVSLAVQ